MIAGMKVGCGDLVSTADCESHSIPQVKPSDDKTRRYEVLLLSIVLALLKESRVELHLGP